jgi:hypothetical protein
VISLAEFFSPLVVQAAEPVWPREHGVFLRSSDRAIVHRRGAVARVAGGRSASIVVHRRGAGGGSITRGLSCTSVCSIHDSDHSRRGAGGFR